MFHKPPFSISVNFNSINFYRKVKFITVEKKTQQESKRLKRAKGQKDDMNRETFALNREYEKGKALALQNNLKGFKKG